MQSDEVLRNTAINFLLPKVPLGTKIDERLIQEKMAKLKNNEISSLVSLRISKAMDTLLDSDYYGEH